jgi:hypothetical protein
MHSWRLAQDVKESQGIFFIEFCLWLIWTHELQWYHEWLWWGGLIHGELRKKPPHLQHWQYICTCVSDSHDEFLCRLGNHLICIRYVCWFVLAMAGDGSGWILLSGLVSIGLWNLERLGDFWQTALGEPRSKRSSSQWSASTPAALTHEVRGVALLLPFPLQREVMHSGARRWICHQSL